MNLSLNQIQNNSQCFYNYSFTNITPNSDGTVTGFSNWNIGYKAFKIYDDWVTENKKYEAIEQIVLSTLDGIKMLFDTREELCPYFFYVDVVVDPVKPTPIPYDAVARRIINSKTFKSSKKIQDSAQDLLDIYEIHDFGIQFEGMSNDILKKIKSGVTEGILKEVSEHYSPKRNEINSFNYNLTPPNDFRDHEKMKSYIYQKARQIFANQMK